MVSHSEAMSRRNARAVARLPIPENMRGKNLADLERHDGNDNTLSVVEQWLANHRTYFKGGALPGKGLLFYGKPGTGKTLLSCIVLEALVGQGARGTFIRMDRWRNLKSTEMTAEKAWSKFGDQSAYDEWLTVYERLRMAHDAHMLVLDDVGSEYQSNYTSKLFVDLLRDRFSRGLPTIMTSNLAPVSWGEDYGEAAASFLEEATFVLPISGKDHRRAGG